MSFLLPTADYADRRCCYLEADFLTPELISAIVPTATPEMPTYALWGGGDSCVDLLLTAISDEAANRTLATFTCFSPSPPQTRTALWVEGVGLLKKVDAALPKGCKLIDLTGLASPLSAEDSDKYAFLKASAASLLSNCQNLGAACDRLARVSISLTAPFHDSEKLVGKAARIAAAQPIENGMCCTIPIAAVTASGERLRMYPFGEDVQIVGLRELYGVSARFLELLSDALNDRGADYAKLTDLWSGSVLGIWLPASRICYLTDPPDERQKLMTVSRYLAPRPQTTRSHYRSLEHCRGEIEQQMVCLTTQISEIKTQLIEVEQKALKKSRLGEFRKRLLIDLFCRPKG